MPEEIKAEVQSRLVGAGLGLSKHTQFKETSSTYSSEKTEDEEEFKLSETSSPTVSKRRLRFRPPNDAERSVIASRLMKESKHGRKKPR